MAPDGATNIVKKGQKGTNSVLASLNMVSLAIVWAFDMQEYCSCGETSTMDKGSVQILGQIVRPRLNICNQLGT